MYARYCELRADGRADEAANVLKEIEDYNRYDCRSTHKLRDWLIKIAIESSVPPLGPQPVADGTAVEDTDELARTLMAFAGDGVDGAQPGTDGGRVVRGGAWISPARGQAVLVGAFRPAEQPRRRMGRHQRRVPGRRVAEVVKDWHLPSSRARKQQRWVKLTGTLAAGGLDSSVFALYDPPSPAGLTDNPDRRAAGNAEIIDVDDPNIPTEVIICEREPKDGGTFHAGAVRADAGQALPDEKLRESIDAAAADVAAGLPAPARQRDRRHPAAPHPAHPQRRTAATYRRYRHGHHGRPARPRLVVPGGARPARHRQDLHGGQDHRAGWSTTTSGGSASSRSHMRWWRTCSAI